MIKRKKMVDLLIAFLCNIIILNTVCGQDAALPGNINNDNIQKWGGRHCDLLPSTTMDQFRQQLLYPHCNKDLSSDNILSESKAMVEVPLKFRLPFFGFHFNYVWVMLNGRLQFGLGPSNFEGRIKFPLEHIANPEKEGDPTIIAPWLVKQSIPSSIREAAVYYRTVNMDELNPNYDQYTERMLVERIKQDFADAMIGSSGFVPTYAFVVTWRNVSFVSTPNNEAPKTNTYQVVVATDEKRTYAMFNYDSITWTHVTEKQTSSGLAPFIGFNAGNRTRAYEFEPYSQEQRVSRLPNLGFGNGLKGRFYFQVDEEVWPGCCIERDLDVNWKTRPRLTFFPRYGSMLGGTMVNITGPCFFHKKSNIRCKFDTLEVDGHWRSINHVSCISPAVMYHGYVDLSVSVENGPFLFSGKYYIQPPDMVDPDVTVLQGQDRLEAPKELVLQWQYDKLSWNTKAPVTLSLWGYRETNENYPRLTYIDVLTDDNIANGVDYYRLDLEPLRSRNNWDKLDITYGFIAVNITNPKAASKDGIEESPILWSRPMPLGWYFRHQWERKHGKDWKGAICENWFYREKYSDRFAITIFRCPCTLQQAHLDRGRFAPDLQCNDIDRKCETFHKAAYHCIRTGRPAVGGAGQLCCYDDHGELIRTGDTMYGGRPARAFQYGKHPFKQKMMIPALSYWLHDVSPFFFCCKWAEGEDDSETCEMFKYWRTSQDCSLYQPPGVASVFGDPHFVTFDRVNYTFNGKGEYVLTRVNHPMHKLDVQGRFEQPTSKHMGDPPINGTRLTAIVARDNTSSVVEFRVRKDAARWLYHMYVIVDQEYIYFWDNSMRVQYFKGVTLYQPTNVYNMSHVVAMFDSGAGVEVKVENGHMAVHVYLPLTFLNKTAGLLGNWTRQQEDDFALPDGSTFLFPKRTGRLDIIHKDFGKRWRLTEIENDAVGVSMFFHKPIPFSEFDNESFVAEYNEKPIIHYDFPYRRDEVESVCSDSTTCYFDFVVTRDVKFAIATKNHERYAQGLAADIRKQAIRCPELAKPRHGRKSEIRYFVGTTVRFSCDDGYRLVGYENRKCHDTGLWSWGVDPECISESDYGKKVAGISLGIVLPLLIVGILLCCCVIGRMRQRKSHWTGERGLYSSSILEMKTNSNRNGPPMATTPVISDNGRRHEKEADV